MRLISHSSRLIKAMQGWKEGLETYSEPPEGMFGRIAIIKSSGVTLNSEELDIEFNVPFDDDAEANEAEIIVYNLSQKTIQALKWNNRITIEAGYKGDTGLIFEGRISKVQTKFEGVDKKTTIYALDDVDLKERDITEKAYAAGTKASYILKDLISQISLPLAVFKIKRDWDYDSEVNVSGGLMENIKKYAAVCGISVYINKGKMYARHITEGDNINFLVSQDTGLIDSPEEFEEEMTAEDYKNTIKGYKFKMILQHRMTTAVVIKLSARNISGWFRVRKGTHIFNGSESVTEVEAVYQ